MMLTVSETIYSHLKAFGAANADLFAGDIYPLIAPMDAHYPFAVYRASKRVPFSKKGIHEVDLKIVLVGDDYDYLCDITDRLEDYLAANFKDAEYQSTVTGVNQDKPSEMNFELTYNLKMI